MSEKQFYDHADDGVELSAFEQQLRSIDPAPPENDWHRVLQAAGSGLGAESGADQTTQDAQARNEASNKAVVTSALRSKHVASKQSATGLWRIATHSAATLIGVGMGMAIGVAIAGGWEIAFWEIASPSAVAKDPASDVVSPDAAAFSRDAAIARKPPVAVETNSASRQLANNNEVETERYRLSSKTSDRDIGSFPLTPLAPLASEFNPRHWRNVPPEMDALPTGEPVTSNPATFDEPKSAPELMREMLKGIASLRSS